MNLILCAIWLHFIGDFLLQSDDMALNKSSSNWWLAFHSIVYSLPFLLIASPFFSIAMFFSHFIIDWVSSRVTKVLWERGDRHWFFVTIGLDQAIHLTILISLLGVL